MLDGWTVILVALAYFGSLFAIASYGDARAKRLGRTLRHPVIYTLTLGIYCTSWTFFGSVGLAARKGLDFLPIYLGPILVLAFAGPLLRHIIRLTKSQNITSIADFISARYGKSQQLAAVVTVIAIVGTVPYISLQLKAMSTSVLALLGPGNGVTSFPVDTAMLIAIIMAAFAILFGTRHIDATEHQDGLMMAIAAESVIKLFAFITVGIFITFGTFGGIGGLMEAVNSNPEIYDLFAHGSDGGVWLTMMLLSTFAIMLLPRQFHAAFVENAHEDDTRKAAWLFPLYLVAINLFVVPIAVAGLLAFPDGGVDADLFVLALPMSMEQPFITLLAFLGGLSAATAMIIVAAVALSIMACNNLVMPMILRRRLAVAERENMGPLLLNIRRSAIILILFFAYIYVHMVGESFPLASIGLLSFAAIAQFAPAFFGGLIWRRATAKGAIAGILAGFCIWAYTLLLPSFVESGWIGEAILKEGPFGIGMLRPQMLLNLSFAPLTHGVFWSLLANILAFVLVSLSSRPQPVERLQALLFSTNDFALPPQGYRFGQTGVTVGDLKKTAARYLGQARMERSFKDYDALRHSPLDDRLEADLHILKFTENLLASAVGAASSRLVMTLILGRGAAGEKGAMMLLDDVSQAIQYNRDLLQSALDHVSQGLGVFDRDTRLVCWNRQFRSHLKLPPEMGRVGVPVADIISYMAEKGELGEIPVEEAVSLWTNRIVKKMETFQQRLSSSGRVLELRTDAMPEGGLVLTISDITEAVEASLALENRVIERTAELNHARAEAEKANESKTRFLAAAGHDILQPLNAARLYTSSLVERCKAGAEEHRITAHIDMSLEAVEDIMSALLDIARLDAGAMKPDMNPVSISEVFSRLAIEFEPMASERKLDLRIINSSLGILSDRLLLRRVLQNLLSNAIKYTPSGKIVMGARRRGDQVLIEVHDSGPGIAKDKQQLIFQEFKRLDEHSTKAGGLGLGLSIVERIATVLDHKLELVSRSGSGSAFSLSCPRADMPAKGSGDGVLKRAAPMKLTGLRVLCIDNDPDILDGMRVLLQGWECEPRLAGGVGQAEQQAASFPLLDIMLVDYHLDDGNGLDAISRINNISGRHIPAILITADRSNELRDKAHAKGVSVLNKPIKPAALRAMMTQARLQKAAE